MLPSPRSLLAPSHLRIRAVAFDLWETLITNSPEVSRRQHALRVERLAAALFAAGHTPPHEVVEEAHREVWSRCQELYWSVDRDVPCRRQVEHLVECLGLDPAGMPGPALQALEEAYADTAVVIPPHPVEGAHEVLQALRSRGLRLGLISNTGRTPGSALRRILDGLGLASFIEVMVFSNEHGHCKPQPSIFEALRSGLGVAASELVFVGDNPYVDVHGAQRCGMRAVLFEPGKRGTAVAPPVEHGLEITPDARVRSLRDLIPWVEEQMRTPESRS